MTAEAKAPEEAAYKLQTLNVADIVEAGFSLREAQLKDPQFLELEESVKQHGVLEPILVRPFMNPLTKQNEFQLINGCQRLTAAKRTGRKTIPCKIQEMDNRTAMLFQITTNSAKVETRPAQYAALIKTMMDMEEFRGCSLVYLAGQLTMSVEKLTRLLSLSKLSDEIRKLVDDGKMTVANAVALASLPVDAQTEMLDDARSMTAEDFKMAAAERKNEITAEKRGNGGKPVEYVHNPKFRKLDDIQQEIAAGTQAKVSLKGVTDPLEAYRLGLQFTLTCTPVDIAEGKAAWEAKRAEAAAKREAAKAEREAAKEAAAIADNA